MRCLLVFLLFSLSPIQRLKSQESISDSASVKNIVLFYQQTLGRNMLLYNGPEYVWTYVKSVGHPFFITDSLQQGTVSYDGIVYYNMPLFYELVQQEVLLEGVEKFKIKLNKEKVQGFSIKGHQFKWIAGNSTINAGFYEHLVIGMMPVFVRYQKKLTQQFNPADPYIFQETASFFIEKDGRYYSINDQDDLLQIVSDHKKRVRDYWKENKLSFKKNAKEFIVNTIEFYTRIN